MPSFVLMRINNNKNGKTVAENGARSDTFFTQATKNKAR